MERLIEAIELMILAGNRLEEVDYVYDTLKKYKKLNPFIAKSNTSLSDKENIIRFDGYATEALELFYRIPEEELEGEMVLKILASVLLEEYERESKALEQRLDIYDSSLLEQAHIIRAEHMKALNRFYISDARQYMKHLMPLLEENVKLKGESIQCEQKIKANQEVHNSYSKKVLFRKNAQKTVEQAVEYMQIQKQALQSIEKKKQDLKGEIQVRLRSICSIQ